MSNLLPYAISHDESDQLRVDCDDEDDHRDDPGA